MTNSKKMEQIIGELDNLVANAKFKAFSSTDIIVNKEDIESLIITLRRNMPEEVKLYQKVLANQDKILSEAAARADHMLEDAKQKSQDLLNQAAAEHNQMISEHEIMQRAQARADEYVNMAMNQAQNIIDNATMEANALRDAANRYMEEILQHLSKLISSSEQTISANYSRTMQATQDSCQKLVSSLSEYQGIIQDNIRQLHPEEAASVAEETTEEDTEEE